MAKRGNKGALRSGQRLDKYRVQRKLGEGGFATVYQALDTIEGIRVALKLPHRHLLSTEVLDDFRREVRLAARLDHQNILPLKNASFIDDRFVIVYALGERTLDERLRRRLAFCTAWEYAEQILSAVAYAHRHCIIHCDIKPENLILFPEQRVRLADFGIARVAQRTMRASGSGTLGYMAPEQAMGRPGFRSDVFSIGLILYRMFSGALPEYPFDWPPPGYGKIRRLHPDLVRLLARAMQVSPRRRFRDANQMLDELLRIRKRSLDYHRRRSQRNGSARR
jgi:serine/threonine-protein kinase